ncbi:MAG: U32 family peptidase [Bacteroidales bacterium]
MQIELELLAPAKNKQIGIAAIDCGADAVYIAGPRFGAREAAGNSISDIAQLVIYAHQYRTKVYMVLNTILYDNELEEARQTIIQAHLAGCDAIIIQDLAILAMELPPIPLFASTQTNIRTPEQAQFLQSLGFRRLILARELSLQQISAIKSVTNIHLESFVHGALCVSYSGQCYLSEKLTGRSANRGCCAQACRSNYTLTDSNGTVLAKNTPLLSLKDFNASSRIPELTAAGITSFKIEGRLKNESYIKNIVLHYRRTIDKFLAENKTYRKASYGECSGGFTPNPATTFNRGYTQLFIDGKRGDWRSTDGAKYLGEYIGTIITNRDAAKGTVEFTYTPRTVATQEDLTATQPAPIRNGDGLCFVTPKGEILGARANSCNGNTVTTIERMSLPARSKIYRNYNIAFEKELEKNMPKRLIPVELTLMTTPRGYALQATCSEDFTMIHLLANNGESASNPQLAEKNMATQLSKTTDIFSFTFNGCQNATPAFYPISVLNQIRRNIAADLSKEIQRREQQEREISPRKPHEVIPFESGSNSALSARTLLTGKQLTYLANCSNNLSKELYISLGASAVSGAYELEHPAQAELMRTKYCIKYELGLCQKEGKKAIEKYVEPFFLLNGNNKLQLKFDCKNCEMLIIG